MGTRIGFMESKKAGRCFYCKEEIPASTEGNKVICGYDNNIKRRICNKCGHDICTKGGDVVAANPPAEEEKKPKLFSAARDELLHKLSEQISKLDERIGGLEKQFAELTGDGQ
jgi:hypothetical protein